MRSKSAVPGAKRRENESSGWSVISQRQSIDAELDGEPPRLVHLLVRVVPVEEDVAPVELRHVAAGRGLLVGHRAQVGDRQVELAALPVAHVGLLRGAVDREGHLVDARVDQPPRFFLVEGQAVGAGVEVDVRELRLDVLAHLDGALVQERLAVVEEVDPAERRAGLVDHPREQVEVEHAGLAGPGDAGLGRAAGLETRDVAGGGALDVEPAGQRRRRAGRAPAPRRRRPAAASAGSRRRSSSRRC